MVQMSVSEVCTAVEGTLLQGDPNGQVEGAVLDSRATRPGQVFFALAGAETDGHRFVSKALKAGAGAAVISRPTSELDGEVEQFDGALIQVPDTYRALHDLVRDVRTRTPQHLVAITGSAGKTTTKELLTAMLKQRFRAAPSPGNFNNLFGFPLALMSVPNDTEWMVAEMGMSTPGELGGVSELGRPDIGIFTNVRHAHVEGFEREGDLGGRTGEEVIRDAKAELLRGLDPDGLVIVNAADPQTVIIAERFLAQPGKGRALGFAMAAEHLDVGLPVPLAVELIESSAEGHQLVLIDSESGRRQELQLPLYGTVNVENFLAAATCAHALGVDLSQIAEAVAATELPQGRGAVVTAGEVLLIDDSYNSNPSALERALKAAAALRAPGQDEGQEGRLWAVLGEMKELGSLSSELHREAGELAGALGFDRVVGVGEMARELLAGAGEAGTKVQWFEDATAAEAIAQRVRPGDVVLIKGSRSVGLERVVDALRRTQEQALAPQQPGVEVD